MPYTKEHKETTRRRILESAFRLFTVKGFDGVTVNEISLGTTNTYTRYLSLYSIKQVEIIRGPGSALYGSNAVLGVVNLITEKDSKTLTLAKGTQNRSQFAMNYGENLRKDFKLYTNAEIYIDEGFEYQINDSLATRDPRVYQKMNVGLSYKALEYELMYSHEETNQFYNFRRIDNNVNHNETQNVFSRLSYRAKIGGETKLTPSVSFYRWNWDDYGVLVPAGAAASSHNFYGGPYSQSSKYSFELNGETKLSKRDVLIYGVEANHYGLDYSGAYSNHYDPISNNIAPVEAFYTGSITAYKSLADFEEAVVFFQNYGAYAQYKKTVFKKFTVHTGGRLDYYSHAGESFSPRVAMVYRTPLNSSFKIMYGEAFRAPVHNEMLGKSPSGSGNDELSPEKSRTIEVEYIQDLEKGEFAVNYFFTSVSNLILVEEYEEDPSVTHGVNSSAIFESSGLEFSTKLNLFNSLYVRGTFTTILNSTSNLAFQNFGTLALTYTKGKFGVSVHSIFREERGLIDQDNYALLNGKISYAAPKGINLFIQGSNLLNTTYYTYAETIQPNQIMLNRGRELKLGLSFDLDR